MGGKITWGGNRELNKYDFDIKQYYKNLSERWNKLSDYINEPTDRRTNYYYAYHQFFEELLYMWDMIRQTEQQQQDIINSMNKKIEKLEKELSKWTNQQAGRTLILTDEQQQQIKAWKEENISNREIAKRLKVSEGTIRNEIKRMGIDS